VCRISWNCPNVLSTGTHAPSIWTRSRHGSRNRRSHRPCLRQRHRECLRPRQRGKKHRVLVAITYPFDKYVLCRGSENVAPSSRSCAPTPGLRPPYPYRCGDPPGSNARRPYLYVIAIHERGGCEILRRLKHEPRGTPCAHHQETILHVVIPGQYFLKILLASIRTVSELCDAIVYLPGRLNRREETRIKKVRGALAYPSFVPSIQGLSSLTMEPVHQPNRALLCP